MAHNLITKATGAGHTRYTQQGKDMYEIIYIICQVKREIGREQLDSIVSLSFISIASSILRTCIFTPLCGVCLISTFCLGFGNGERGIDITRETSMP